MENNKKTNNVKRLAAVIGTGALLSVALVGSAFGFYDAVKNRGPIDNLYNQRVLIQSEIELEGDTTIKDAAVYVEDTLAFIGENNANIWTSGDNTLFIDAPIDTYKSKIDKNAEEKENIFDQMETSSNNTEFISDIAKLYVSTLFNANLDFRNEAGEQVFVENGNGYQFNSEALVAETTTEETMSAYSTTVSSTDYDFYGEADISYSNGIPVINVKIDEENLNMFKEFNNFLVQGQGQETVAPYYIWFGYDQLESFIDVVYDSYDNTGLAQFIGQDWIKPFYVTSSTSEIMTSRFDDEIVISGTTSFTEKQAKYYVNNINNSNSFTSNPSETKVTLYTKDNSEVMLIVLASLFILVIIIVMFLMSWYFGLLGMIASISYLLINMLTAIIYSSIGLTVTFIGLIGLIVSALIVAYMFYGMINIYRNNNKDKYISVYKRFAEKFKIYNKQNFSPMVVLLITIFICGMLMPAILAASLYLLVITFTMSYLFILITMVVFYGLDVLIGFTFQDYDVKWAFNIGQIDRIFNKEIKYNDSISKVRTTVISLSSIIILLLSLVTGGIIFGTTGSVTNSNMYGSQNYLYNVELIDPNSLDLISDDEEYLVYLEDFYNEVNSLTDEVETAFDNAGVKTTSVSVVRNDSINYSATSEDSGETFTSNLTDEASFGFNVTSRVAIDNETFTKVNEELAKIDTTTKAMPNEEDSSNYISNNEIGFVLTKTLSLSESTSTKVVANRMTNVTNDRSAINGIFILLIFIVVFSFIILFVSRWGAALAIFITSSIEAILIYAPIFLLFVPYVQLLIFPIVLLMSLSAAVKTYVIKKVKDDEKQTEDIWIKHTENQQFLVPALSTVIAVLSLLMIPVLGLVYSFMFALYTLFIGFVILLTQRYVFTYFARILTNFNNRVKDNKVSDDIRRSKNSEEPCEEYIEGINM